MPKRARVSKFSQPMPSDSEVYAGGEEKQEGYSQRPERTLAIAAQGLMADSHDQYDQMSRDGLQYGDPEGIRYPTGRRDARPPKFNLGEVPTTAVSRRRAMRQK